MKNTKKLSLAGVFIALAVVGSMFSFPFLGSKCSPVQHLINVLSAIMLGPWYSVGIAFVASVIRVMLGLGTFMAFPGSMCGALLAGILYLFIRRIPSACVGELFGTSIIGGLLAYPVAVFLIGNKTAAIFSYIIPFFISSVVGTIIAAIIAFALIKTGVLKEFIGGK